MAKERNASGSGPNEDIESPFSLPERADEAILIRAGESSVFRCCVPDADIS
jgi:hypothetical protein